VTEKYWQEVDFVRRFQMKWLLDFFYCRSWREFLALAVLASMAFIVIWALLFLTIILFG
jgi:hypothetical protein